MVLLFFALIATTIVSGVAAPMIRELRMSRDLQHSKQSYFTAEAGSEDVYYRVKNNQTTSFPEVLSFDGATATTTIEIVDLSNEDIVSQGTRSDHVRTVVKGLTVTDGFDFEYALQTGIGGISLANNASVNGNIYSNGPITSSNSNPNSYNVIHGAIVSAGATGTVSYVRSTSTVYAHFIHHATVDKDAYYQSFSGATSTVTITGTSYPNSADQPTISLPITDTLIASWESDASVGGNVTCTNGAYAITSSVTIGPKKIPCDLSITGNGTIVTLKGAVWVTGNISISGSGGTGVQLKVDDSIGNKSVPVVADNPGSNLTSAKISIDGNSTFYGSTGNASSYVMMVSQNNSAESGGVNLAMDIINGATGNLLTYAAHGQVRLQNNVNLREVTAYKINPINNAIVNYSIGLAQPLFTSGAGGSWKIRKWKER